MDNIKGVIFDLDGVIIHTDEFHFQAWKQVADRNNIRFERSDNDRLRGVSRMESLEIILEKADREFSGEEKEKTAEAKNEIYKNYLAGLSESDVDPEVIDTLKLLKEKGLKLAIGSSSRNAGLILKNTGLSVFFDAVSDGNNITNSKPHPEVFLKAAEYLNLNPSECAVVEDARSGVDAAVAGGFICFGMGDAYGYEKATVKIKSLGEIKTVLNF